MNIFPRPTPKAGNGTPPPRPKFSRPPGAIAAPPWRQPWPRLDATISLLIGFIITAFAMAGGDARPTSSGLAHTTAVGVGLSLLVSFAFELRSGLRNLVRADLMGILALYYLTLWEFLFPQPFFDVEMRFPDVTYKALWAVMLGFTGIAIGRHLIPKGRQPFEQVMTKPVPPNLLVYLFWGSFVLGYLHMFLGVNFDIPKMLDYMTRPRFEQPWGRGKFGDWKALINELSLLLYFIPPLTALVLARRHQFSPVVIISTLLGFGWTLFYGFCSGTRNLFGAYLVTFMIAFAFATPAERRQQVVLVCACCAAAFALATGAMLQMRTVGFQRWWKGEYTEYANRQSTAVFVDDNLLAIGKIAAYFPARSGYLGGEIPYLALVRPIPRALWKGKPEGLSISVEEHVFQMRGLTISSTFVGEGYMSGGLVGVSFYALVLGALAGLWNRMASPRNSDLGILIYSSGFFAVVITMRSIMTLTTALLTPAAGILAGMFLIKGARKVLGGRGAPPRRPQMPPPPQRPA
jgi:hypothetical protein